ncbi:MAG: aa3-type cytochrome c oxidase subunit IV [Alphaproteobacteria bacterium]|nr:aa3-type cytochrome c oxidase subunit IV [Alphaproteobacteria bacterium]
MADHGNSGSHVQDMDEHRSTYEGFLKGSVALTLICLFTLVALVAFRFVNTGNLLLGFGGLIIGCLAVLIDARAGNKWYLSGGLLVVYGLITAVAVS